mgnify:CR=1 FL=1
MQAFQRMLIIGTHDLTRLGAAGKPDLGPVTMDSTDWKSALTLSLAEGSNGTTITSTRSILYGYVTARIRSAAGSGILTSFTLLSGTADEILFE